MVEPLRHRQTKEAATDMFDLQPPRHISTLPSRNAWLWQHDAANIATDVHVSSSNFASICCARPGLSLRANASASFNATRSAQVIGVLQCHNIVN